MTGDEIDRDRMVFSDKSDIEVALMARMLMRDQLNHEQVCTGSRDRIMFLSQEVERLNKQLKDAFFAGCDFGSEYAGDQFLGTPERQTGFDNYTEYGGCEECDE